MTPTCHNRAQRAGCIAAILLLAIFAPCLAGAADGESGDRKPLIAVRTNMLYDAALIPTFGLELSPDARWSFAAEGAWAWWSRHSRNRCWRVYGLWFEMRRWLGSKPEERALTGHHAGIYGSYYSYDFEFGHRGWQAPQVLGVGASYGYSVKVGTRVNIDFGVKAGFSIGHRTEYVPQCGEYVSVKRGLRRYFGITGLEISLVWFPGKGKANNPVSNEL